MLLSDIKWDVRSDVYNRTAGFWIGYKFVYAYHFPKKDRYVIHPVGLEPVYDLEPLAAQAVLFELAERALVSVPA